MSPSEALYRELKQLGVDFVVHVPCKLLDNLITRWIEPDPEIFSTAVTREEEGLGILAGAHLAGRRPAIVMQNSGLGNSINAIQSLLGYFAIPVLFIISHRGSAGEPIAAQKPMGAVSLDLLAACGVPAFTIAGNDDLAILRREAAARPERSLAFLFPFSYWREVRTEEVG